MQDLLATPIVQYGALGLAGIIAAAFVKAFFQLMAQRQAIQEDLLRHHQDRERAFTEQFIACIDRNSAALEKVEQSLTRMQIQMAQSGEWLG